MMIRYPAFAGSFYPDNAQILKQSIVQFLEDAPNADANIHPKALIVPHAGYIYSGSIAASAYNYLSNSRNLISRVILLGPSHRISFRGIACPEADFFQTPLGDVPIDTESIHNINHLKGVSIRGDAHNQEHCLEVHLPFLQHLLSNFTLIPLVVGQTEPSTVETVLNMLWGDVETLIIVSTDLSHYLPYDQAQEIDTLTSKKIEKFSSNIIGKEACGCYPLNGFLHAAKKLKLTLTTVDLRSSGDTAGAHDQVVGYGAYVIH